MRYKKWNVASPDPAGRAALEGQGIPPLAAAVLSARGLCGAEQARGILSAEGKALPDGFLMKDMDRAVARIRLALENKEKIAVYGDYDVDGITATCLLTRLLGELGGQVIPYIPNRMEEGYGLNCRAVSALADKGVRLIITVDCGITATQEVQWAAGLGVDVVITDHHECKDELPDACAVVDPHRPDCPYPFKGLAGVGVALKLGMALAGPEQAERVLEEYADLAAIGTVADVMPVVEENRTIIQRGLRSLEHPRRVGIAMLVREAGLENRPLNSVTIGYTLAPRINAAGRMGRAEVAVSLLLTRDAGRAAELARELCRLNRERQAVELGIFEQCIRRLEQQPQHTAIVLADTEWHQGVVGIVASRLTEKYSCPAVMICLSGGVGKGSCRSWGGINLFAALEGCQDLLEAFGGHELAAGFTIREENIPALTERLAQQVRLQQGQEQDSVLDVDVMLDDMSLLELEQVQHLEMLEPYGGGNPRPVLALSGAQVLSAGLVGGGRHLKLKLGKRGAAVDAIFFSAGDWIPDAGSRVDAAFSPQVNEYRGNRTVQLQVVDLRPAPSRAELEQQLYDRYRRGEVVSPEQARALLPEREQFVTLWRWLKRQCDRQQPVEAAAAYIARAVARAAGRRESLLHTMVCLDVMQERGLITLDRMGEQLQISLIPSQEKVELESSPILRRLRELAAE